MRHLNGGQRNGRHGRRGKKFQKIHALDKVLWSTSDEAEFCRMDKAASRHTARGIDAGTDSETGLTWKNGMDERMREHTRFRCNDIPEKGEHRCLPFLPIGT